MTENPTVLHSGWYDQQESKKILNIAERTLREWVQMGRIRTKPNPQNTRQRLYKAADIDHLAEFGPPKPPRKKPEPRPTVDGNGNALPPPAVAKQIETARMVLDLFREYFPQQAAPQLLPPVPPPPPAPFLTVEAAAKEYDLTEGFLRRMIHARKISAERAGPNGALRIRRASLEKFAHVGK